MSTSLAALALAFLGSAALPAVPVSGEAFVYEVKAADTLRSIGARFGLDPSTLAADNALAVHARLKPGQVLLVDNRHIVAERLDDGIVVNVPQRRLYVFAGGRLTAAYPVAVGRPGWPTPAGSFVVSSKETDPTWDVPLSIQQEMSLQGKPVTTKVPPGPDSPLGDRWLRISNLALGLHGTNRPASIFGFTTHGCIRLHPDDVRALFDITVIGTPVRIVYRPVLVADLDAGHVLVEIHRDVYRRAGSAWEAVEQGLRTLGAEAVDPTALRRAAREATGRIVVVEVRRHVQPGLFPAPN